HHPTGLTQLRQMAADDRLPHANLLLAAPGTGGLPAALALATFLLCENRSEKDACGTCRACRKSTKYVHPDLHFAFPVVGSKVISDQFLPQWRETLTESAYFEVNDWLQKIGAENKQGNINKDECAAILRKLSLKTFESRYKVMLIWLPEYLGNEGNRLLKMIEEPPEGTIFILVAERAELILNTILSRCQLTKLSSPRISDIEEFLHASGVESDIAAAAARLADGNLNLAQRLVNSPESSHGARFLAWMRACHSGSATKLVEWSNEFAKVGRENQKNFLHYALHFWREFLLLSVQNGEETGVKLLPDELATAKKMLAIIQLDQVGSLSEIINECIEHVERNANPKILFLDAGIRINKILRPSKVVKKGTLARAIK
ncbi:MAG: hypothetical protein AAFQ37_01860, partial [Bacteroidota bacterium]